MKTWKALTKYYLKTLAPNGNKYTKTTYPLLGEIVKNCPQVEAATHIQRWYYPWLKYNNKEFQETTDFIDTGYFKVPISFQVQRCGHCAKG